MMMDSESGVGYCDITFCSQLHRPAIQHVRTESD
jgi:hypothetical protein